MRRGAGSVTRFFRADSPGLRGHRLGSELGQSAEAAVTGIEHRYPIVLDPGVGEEVRRGPRADDQLGLHSALREQARKDERANQTARIARQVREQARDHPAEPLGLL